MRSVAPPAAGRKTRIRRSAATVSCVLLSMTALFSAAVLQPPLPARRPDRPAQAVPRYGRHCAETSAIT